MEWIKFFRDIHKNSVAIAGGKGASLGEMTRLFGVQAQAHNPVPPGFIVLAAAFDRFVEETHLKEEIDARLGEVNTEDTNSIDRASNVLRDVIHDTAMPKDLAEQILQAFDALEAEYVAVRSSATAEDSAVASWAGELDTFLNTTRDNVIAKVKQCWSSLFTPRAIFYRHEKNLIDAHVSVAVVVQKMVQSDVSGVAFTVHPVTEDYNQMIIEAVYGLGEALVSGQVTPDSYVISKSDISILDINVGQQTKKLIRNVRTTKQYHRPGRGPAGERDENTNCEQNEWVELGEEGGKQKLSGKQIMAVAEMCIKIEKHYGFPCDIEWAMENGVLYITQSRPITTLKK